MNYEIQTNLPIENIDEIETLDEESKCELATVLRFEVEEKGEQ